MGECRAPCENPSRLCREESTPRRKILLATQATQEHVSDVYGNRSFRPQVISPRLLSPLFSSHLAHFKCNVSRSRIRKAKQACVKCNFPRFLSHKPNQANFKYNIPRSKIGG